MIPASKKKIILQSIQFTVKFIIYMVLYQDRRKRRQFHLPEDVYAVGKWIKYLKRKKCKLCVLLCHFEALIIPDISSERNEKSFVQFDDIPYRQRSVEAIIIITLFLCHSCHSFHIIHHCMCPDIIINFRFPITTRFPEQGVWLLVHEFLIIAEVTHRVYL